MAEQTATPAAIELPSDYQERVNTFTAGQAVVGPCPKCHASGRFEWVSNAIETRGQTLNGACKQCNGKGFLTLRDQERNAQYLEYRAGQIARASAFLARNAALADESAPI